MNNACPGCGAVYAVAEKDIGRRIACKKCSASLVVDEEGLKYADEESRGAKANARDPEDDFEQDDANQGRGQRDADDEDDDKGKRRGKGGRNARKSSGINTSKFVSKLKEFADITTWLYCAGLVLTIFSFFAKSLDTANINNRQGKLSQAELNDKSDARSTSLRNDGKPSDADLKAREKRRKAFEEDEKLQLSEDIETARASALKAEWWNLMYRLIGFAILAFASMGYLNQNHSPMKRLLGGVTILLILMQVIGGGVGISINVGGK